LAFGLFGIWDFSASPDFDGFTLFGIGPLAYFGFFGFAGGKF
jgi:hypothetical protein